MAGLGRLKRGKVEGLKGGSRRLKVGGSEVGVAKAKTRARKPGSGYLALLVVCLRRVVLPGLAGNNNDRGDDG